MKKVKLIISFLLISGIIAVYAGIGEGNAPKTVTLTGKVTDKANHETLAGALITVEGTNIETYTDFDGNFTISGLIPDTYKIKCTMISYNDNEEEVVIDKASKDINIPLENVSASKSAR